MKKILISAICLGMPFVNQVFSQTIAQWRGIDRKGVYHEQHLLHSWPAGGPGLIWSSDSVGNGYGAPAVTADRLYITGETDSVEYLYAFDLSGHLLWKNACGREWMISYPGSRSTPTVTIDGIYVCTGLGDLTCFDPASGQELWTVNMIGDLHGTHALHGHSESPLVDGDKVFLTPGGADTNVVALNRHTGKILWICKGRGERSAYNSPILINLPARKLLVTFSAYAIMGIDTETGQMLWWQEQDTYALPDRKPGYGDTHSNSAWYEDGTIYYIAGDGNGAVKLKLSADGSQVQQVWRNQSIDNFMGGFIKTGNSIFTCGYTRKNLQRLDAETGISTDSLKCGAGTIIMADGMLYYYNQRGEMNLIKWQGGQPQIISTFRITRGKREHFSHPVISDGIFYLRRGNALMAFEIKEKR